MDAGGAADAAYWIQHANPIHPSLIDREHLVATRYGWVNVPSIAWIDEEGRLVRPNDAGWAGEYFRGMMQPGFDMDAMRAEHDERRERYLAAVRDWVTLGTRSRYALTADEVRRRLPPADGQRARGAALFRLGVALHERGRREDAQRAFAEARVLQPDSWNHLRQSLHLKEAGASGGPAFWAAVDALGARRYYPNQEF
jgi:hypothetical protein